MERRDKALERIEAVLGPLEATPASRGSLRKGTKGLATQLSRSTPRF